MEYGKPFGIASGATFTVTGFKLGYGWIVAGVCVVTIICVVVIRLMFRKGKKLGQ